MEFWISKWISGFQSGFLNFVRFLDFRLDFCQQCTRFLSWRTPLCKGLQRSPLYPGLSHHAKQILGPAFGSRLLLSSIWHNFLIFSPHNQPGNEPRAVCDPMHTQGLMRLCMAYLSHTTTADCKSLATKAS